MPLSDLPPDLMMTTLEYLGTRESTALLSPLLRNGGMKRSGTSKPVQKRRRPGPGIDIS